MIFSCGDFLARFDKKDKGKTKAALPAKTNPSRIELTPTDFPGLRGNINENKAKLPPHKTKELNTLYDIPLIFYNQGRCIMALIAFIHIILLPITYKFPLLDIQGIHANVKEQKDLSTK